MLASQRLPNQASCTEMRFVERIVLHKLVNRFLRPASACSLWNEARVGRHGHEVEIRTQAVAGCKGCVQEGIGGYRICQLVKIVHKIGTGGNVILGSIARR